jgi:hypothetical protein
MDELFRFVALRPPTPSPDGLTENRFNLIQVAGYGVGFA